MQNIITLLVAIFLIFPFLIFCQNEKQQQKPIEGGSFVQLFDQNGDAKVELGREVKEYYVNATIQLNSLFENCTNSPNITDQNQIAVGDIIDSEDFYELNFIDAKLLSTLNASTKADLNGDGRLSVGEKTQFTMNVVAEYHLDNNKDGFVDANESLEYDIKLATIQFKEFDKNQEGKLDVDELREFVALWRPPYNSLIDNALPANPFTDLSLEKAIEFFGIKYGIKPEQIRAADFDNNGNLTFKEFFDNIGTPMEIAKRRLVGLLKELIDDEMFQKADRNGNGAMDRGEAIDFLTLDLAMKIGDTNKDGKLNEREFSDAFLWYQGYHLGLNQGWQKDKIRKICTQK